MLPRARQGQAPMQRAAVNRLAPTVVCLGLPGQSGSMPAEVVLRLRAPQSGTCAVSVHIAVSLLDAQQGIMRNSQWAHQLGQQHLAVLQAVPDALRHKDGLQRGQQQDQNIHHALACTPTGAQAVVLGGQC